MKLIGLCGRANSGKDEIANILAHTYNFKKISFAKPIKELVMKYFGYSEQDVFVKKPKQVRFILQVLGSCIRQNITKFIQEIQSIDPNTPDFFKSFHQTTYATGFIKELTVKYFNIEPEKLNTKKNKIFIQNLENLWINEIINFAKLTNQGTEENNIWIEFLKLKLESGHDYVISDVRLKNEKKFIESMNGVVIKVERSDRISLGELDNHITETDLNNDSFNFVINNEHKTDWRKSLIIQINNIIRQLYYAKFFTKEEIDKFKVII